MSPVPDRPNAEKTGRLPGVMRRQTALALPLVRQRWAQITQAARQMVRPRRPELRPRLDRLKKFASSLQSRQQPLRGVMRAAKKRPPAWQSMDMVLPNGSSLEEAKPDFMLANLAAGLPGMGQPAGEGHVLPPFESSGSYGQRSPEPKAKASETAARRWKKPAPGSRLHSKIEEIHPGAPDGAAGIVPEPPASVQPPQPILPVQAAPPIIPPPAKAPEAPVLPLPAVEPLPLPRRPRSRIEELPSHPAGLEEEPPQESGPDESPGGPEPSEPTRPPQIPPAPRTAPETIQRQALPPQPQAPLHPRPQAPAKPDLPQERLTLHLPEVHAEKHSPAVSPAEKRPPAVLPPEEPSAADGAVGSPAASAGRPRRTDLAFRPALRRAPALPRPAAGRRSPLFLRQPPRLPLPPLMLLHRRAESAAPQAQDGAPISNEPAHLPRGAALPEMPRSRQEFRTGTPGFSSRPRQEGLQPPTAAQPGVRAGSTAPLSPQPAGETAELPLAASIQPLSAPEETPGTPRQVSQEPLPAPALSLVLPGALPALAQARPAPMGRPARPGFAERFSPLRQTVALRKPLLPVNAARPDWDVVLPEQIRHGRTADGGEMPGPVIPREPRSQAATDRFEQPPAAAAQDAGATAQSPSGRGQPPSGPNQLQPDETAYSLISVAQPARRPAGSAPPSTGKAGRLYRRTPTAPGGKNLIFRPSAAARRIVFRAPLVSRLGRERVLNQVRWKAARAGAAAPRPASDGVIAPAPAAESAPAEFILSEAAAGATAAFLAQPESAFTPAPAGQPSSRPDGTGLGGLEMPPLRGRPRPEAGPQAESGTQPEPGSPPFSSARTYSGPAAASREKSGAALAASRFSAAPAEIIQRSPEPTSYIQREVEGPSVPAAAEPEVPAPDPRELAKLVYPIIKRMLAQERERLRGSS